MTYELPALPYSGDALAPVISAETLSYHHGKHHAAYVEKLNELARAQKLAHRPIEDLVRTTQGPIFEQAAQAWNHAFYWQCMSPDKPPLRGPLAEAIVRSFKTQAAFEEQFTAAAVAQFGSGWAWLVRKRDGALQIVTTGNADTPLRTGERPLLTCDVWEHAYYIDYRNDRKRYVERWWSIVNWDFVAQQLA